MLFTSGMQFKSGFHFIAFAWHEDLGISDQQAGELYKTNPNDPQITGWKNGIQKAVEDFKFVCNGETLDITAQEIIDQCVNSGSDINRFCLRHPGQALICLDPLIAEWAGKNISTTASNSSIPAENQLSNNKTDPSKELETKQKKLNDKFDSIQDKLQKALGK